MIDWTDHTIIQQLRDLWGAGCSTAEIGRRMNTTKNTIVGKAHRLNLPPRPSPVKRDGYVPPPRASRLVTGPTLPPLPSDKPRQGEWITEERKEILGNLWPSRTPSRRIMELLAQSPGTELPSQHGVAAYANTLGLRRPPDSRGGGLPGGDAPIAIPRAPDARPRLSRAIRAPVVTLPQPVVVPVMVVVPRPYGRVVACCWPIGDVGTREFHFCDISSEPGRPYCEEHVKLAYMKIRDRREDAA